MSTIPIDLPDDLRQFVESKVTQGDFESAGEYIAALIKAAMNKRSDIETALVEGLNSGPSEEWTEEAWDEIKSRVRDRHSTG